MTASLSTFSTEANLVRSFVSGLRSDSPWGELQIATEWDYRTGVTDVLTRNVRGDIIAFEAKLRDWRKAAHQAYRNTVFAKKAYVVLPSTIAERACLAGDLFKRYRVGLCSIENKCIRIVIEAPANEALMPWLHARAQCFFDNAACYRQRTKSPSCRGRDLRTAECVA